MRLEEHSTYISLRRNDEQRPTADNALGSHQQ